uniref:G-protein coupled receptors family 1 profile domain-containing protein n=1 Tax=Romanomermis culicivorax TaxID=13658 RepID=A0A915IY77_ROMCU
MNNYILADNLSTNFGSACGEAKILPFLTLFVVEVSLQTLIGPVGFLLNLCFIYCLVKSTIFNRNLRILLAHLSALAAWFTLATFIKGIITLRKLSSSNPCSLVMLAVDCKLSELFVVLPLVAMLYSLFSLGVERLYASIFYTTYDAKSRFILPIILIGSTWTAALTFQLTPLLRQNLHFFVPVCQNLLLSNFTYGLMSVLFGCAAETLSISLFVLTRFLDRTKMTEWMTNRAQQTLTARFQIWQNIEMNKLLLPLAGLHLICWIPTNALALFAILTKEKTAHFSLINPPYASNFENRLQIMYASHILAQIYAILLPFFMLKKNKRFKHHLYRLLNRYSKVTPYVVGHEAHWNKEKGVQCVYAKATFDDPVLNTNKHFQFLELFSTVIMAVVCTETTMNHIIFRKTGSFEMWTTLSGQMPHVNSHFKLYGCCCLFLTSSSSSVDCFYLQGGASFRDEIQDNIAEFVRIRAVRQQVESVQKEVTSNAGLSNILIAGVILCVAIAIVMIAFIVLYCVKCIGDRSQKSQTQNAATKTDEKINDDAKPLYSKRKQTSSAYSSSSDEDDANFLDMRKIHRPQKKEKTALAATA